MSVVVSDPSWVYTKVPFDCKGNVPELYNGCVKLEIDKLSPSVSESLAKTVDETVVIVAVPPSVTFIMSGPPTGVSFCGTTLIIKLVLTSDEHSIELSVAYRIIVLLPVILST